MDNLPSAQNTALCQTPRTSSILPMTTLWPPALISLYLHSLQARASLHLEHGKHSTTSRSFHRLPLLLDAGSPRVPWTNPHISGLCSKAPHLSAPLPKHSDCHTGPAPCSAVLCLCHYHVHHRCVYVVMACPPHKMKSLENRLALFLSLLHPWARDCAGHMVETQNPFVGWIKKLCF